MNPKVEWFFEKASKWQEEYGILRELLLDSELEEELKWGVPCYTINRKNVVLIHGFKEYCALLFHKGSLLKDPAGILIQQTENVQAARQIRFQNIQEIEASEDILKKYILDAIAVEKSGKKVPMKKATEFAMPEEFEKVLNEMPELKKAFYELTPGRQRGYLLYFSRPKQAKTKEARIEKYLDAILMRKGLED